MSKVLFTHSYFYRFDKKQWESKHYYPPLGTITAASFVREKGYNVQLFDTNLAHSPQEIIPILEDFEPEFLVIYDDGFNYLTKMCLSLMREAAFELIEIGKKYNCKIIVSSSDSTDHFKTYLSKGADIILLGEAEESLYEVLNAYQNEAVDFHIIKGIVFEKEDRILNTGRRAVIENLDSLPMAAWDLIEMEAYQKEWKLNKGYFSLNIATTRGCPYSCNWCAKPIFGKKYNSRSPQQVVQEIEFLINKYEARYFWICDDIFGLDSGWVQEFRNLVIERKLEFKYTMQSRVDVMLKDDSISALAESGLDIVWIGAESGSQKVLDSMDKGITVEQIYEARKRLKENDVRVAFFLQFGYPGEDFEDIKATQKMLFDLMPDDMGISVSYPLPGTKFYENVKNELNFKSNWTDSDDLALMFKNTFSAKFYKVLHRYMHKKFRKKQGFEKLKQFIKDPAKNSKGIIRTLAAILYYIPMTLIYRAMMKIVRMQNSNK